MSKEYIGLAGNTFKERFNNHSKSFTQKKYSKETELSKYVWTLKDKEIDYVIKWAILRKSNTFKRKTGICNLCLEEKEILNIVWKAKQQGLVKQKKWNDQQV